MLVKNDFQIVKFGKKSAHIERSLNTSPLRDMKSIKLLVLGIFKGFWIFLVSQSVSGKFRVQRRVVYSYNTTRTLRTEATNVNKDASSILLRKQRVLPATKDINYIGSSEIRNIIESSSFSVSV